MWVLNTFSQHWIPELMLFYINLIKNTQFTKHIHRKTFCFWHTYKEEHILTLSVISLSSCQGDVWKNWICNRRRGSFFYRDIMSSFSHMTLEIQGINTLLCWQVVMYTASTMQGNLQTTQSPHWGNTLYSSCRPPESLISSGNTLEAAVTYLISVERRANINNTIKQEINWHQPFNCWMDSNGMAHKSVIAFRGAEYYKCDALQVNVVHISITAKYCIK